MCKILFPVAQSTDRPRAAPLQQHQAQQQNGMGAGLGGLLGAGGLQHGDPPRSAPAMDPLLAAFHAQMGGGGGGGSEAGEARRACCLRLIVLGNRQNPCVVAEALRRLQPVAGKDSMAGKLAIEGLSGVSVRPLFVSRPAGLMIFGWARGFQ